ncbi:hypothetical protein ACQJBY_050665 [Aegilops geniculata]
MAGENPSSSPARSSFPSSPSTYAGSFATLESVFVVYARFLKDSGASSPMSSSSPWNAKTLSRSSPSSSGPGHHHRNLSPPVVPELDRLLQQTLFSGADDVTVQVTQPSSRRSSMKIVFVVLFHFS